MAAVVAYGLVGLLAGSGGLEWSAPPQCPDEGQLHALIEGHLGDRTLGLQARATVQAGPTGFVLDLEVQRGSTRDQRQVEAEDCEVLARVAALVVALAIDPVAVTRTQAPTRPITPHELEVPSPPPLPPPEPSPRAPVRPAPRASAPSPPETDDARPEFLLSTEGGLETGALPLFSGLVGLDMALAWPRFRLEWGGVFVTPRTEQQTTADVRVMLGAAAFRACLRLRQPRIEVPLCGGVEAGAMRGDGERAPDARTGLGPWVAPTASAALRVPLASRVAIFARGRVAAPILRSGFQVEGPGEAAAVFVPAPVSARATIGLELKIWDPGDRNAGSRRTGDGS